MRGTLEVKDGRIVNYKPGIGFIVVSVGAACNFKCRDCGSFCPYAPPELNRQNVESIIADLKIVLDSVAVVRKLQIQGGEPFIYSDLGKLVEFIGSDDKVQRCIIATNGSITPSDKLMSTLKKNNAEIRISNYNLFPEKISRLEEKCDEFGIKHDMYNFTSGSAQWFDHGGVSQPPPVSRVNLPPKKTSGVVEIATV